MDAAREHEQETHLPFAVQHLERVVDVLDQVEIGTSDLDGGVAQRIDVEFTDDAVHLLAQEGFDPEFGARPLRRTIQRLVENELSRLVLSGEVEPGDRVAVDAERGGVHFEVESGGASELREAEQEAEREPAGTGAQRR